MLLAGRFGSRHRQNLAVGWEAAPPARFLIQFELERGLDVAVRVTDAPFVQAVMEQHIRQVRQPAYLRQPQKQIEILKPFVFLAISYRLLDRLAAHENGRMT